MRLVVILALAATGAFGQQTTSAPGSATPYVVNIQGNASGTPIPVTGTLSSSGAADTIGSTAAFNANNVCASVATAGQTGAGFFLAAGTLAATLTPYVSSTSSADCTTAAGVNRTATSFLDISGNATSTLVVTNPSAATTLGLKLEGGTRFACVCTTSFTSGTASGNLIASTAQPPPPAAGSDVTDRAGRLVGIVTANAGTGTFTADITDRVARVLGVVSVSGSVAVTGTFWQATQPVSGTFWQATQPVSGTFWQATQPVSDSTHSNITADYDTGAGTQTMTMYGVALPASGGAVAGGTATAPVRTDPTGTTTQPVSGTVTTSPPANASTNVAQLAGTTTDTNSGVKSAGTLRVVLATDQPALTNKLLVTPDSVALPANQSVNVSQINAVTPLMGNGVTGTGSQRVTIASDNTAFAIKVSDGTNTAVVTAASTAPVTGSAALTIVESPNSLGCAGQKLSSTSFKNVSMTANTQVITGTAAQNVYICHVDLVTAAANNVAIVEGTGSTCATGTAGMWGGTTAATGWNFAANGGLATGDGMHAIGKTATQADNVCIFVSAAVQLSGSITWVSF